MNPPVLDIIIPAYKARFLARTLESFLGQTDRRFVLYVFDDASPENLEEVIDPFRERLTICYHRFAENMGGHHLALHWNRCVERTHAPWIWLFSDDDLADTDCVACFYRLLESEVNVDVLRYDVVAMIDEEDRYLRKFPPQPEQETSSEYLLQRLRRKRWSFAPEHIFRRSAFEREGGFVDFPLAWHSDDASWIAFARQTGFAAIRGGGVSWRLSRGNVSGRGGRDLSRQKAEATFQYYGWVVRFLEGMSSDVARNARAMLPDYLKRQLFISGVSAYMGHLSWLVHRYSQVSQVGVARAGMVVIFLWVVRSCYEVVVRFRLTLESIKNFCCSKRRKSW